MFLYNKILLTNRIFWNLVLKRGKIDIGISNIILGVLILVGAIIAGEAIYDRLEKIADALNKK